MNRAAIFLLFVPGIAAAQTPSAPAFAAGVRTVAEVDFSTVGTVPANVRFTQGLAAWGDRGGVQMLRASGPTDFTLSLPELLPQHFTIEAELFSRSASFGDAEFVVQGGALAAPTASSAQVVWHYQYMAILGGGSSLGDKYFYPPAALIPAFFGALVHIQIEMDGSHLTYYTEGEQLADIPDLQFKRDRILRVRLGGVDRAGGEVYLAKLRIGSNSGGTGVVAANSSGPTVTLPSSPGAIASQPRPTPPPVVAGTAASGTGLSGLVVQVTPQGSATATWTPLPGATYLAMRWKMGDPVCCNAMSPPGAPLSASQWIDGQLPGVGTYGYRVIAITPSGLVSAEAQASWTGPAAMPIAQSPTAGGPVPIATPAPVPMTAVPAAPVTGTITPAAPANTPGPAGPVAAPKSAPKAATPFAQVPPSSVKVVRTSPTSVSVTWNKITQRGLNNTAVAPDLFAEYTVDRWADGDESSCPQGLEARTTDIRCMRRYAAWQFPKFDDFGLASATKYFYRVTAVYFDAAKCTTADPLTDCRDPATGDYPLRGYSAAPVSVATPPDLNPIPLRNRPSIVPPRIDLAATMGKTYAMPGAEYSWSETINRAADVTWTWRQTPNAIGWVIRIDQVWHSYYDYNEITYGTIHQSIVSLHTSPAFAKQLMASTSYRTCVAIIYDPNAIPDPLKGECLVTEVGP